MGPNRGWYSRGYLPHIDIAGRAQFITWRQEDAVPKQVIDAWAEEMRGLEDSQRRKELASRIERFCDAGYGSCVLADPRMARIAEETLFHDHGRRYSLHAWSIMPNHIHVLLSPLEGMSLERILRTGKSVAATKINKARGVSGTFWQADFFDRLVRDEDHFDRLVSYIEWNPVKAGLITDPKRWEFSSANENACARLEQLLSEREPD